MRRRLLAAVGACAAAVWASAADGPAPTGTPAALVAQLGAERYDDREAAGKALEAAGPAAIPALQAALRSPNPEVARRATQILAKLQRADDSTKRLAAKTVRLAYKDVPLGTAVNDLKARTGLNVTLDPEQVADPLRKITCETGELPVWEAVEAFCKEAGLREVFLAELEVPKSGRQPPLGVSGRRSYYTPPPPPPTPDAVPVLLADGKAAPLPGSRSTAVRVLALPGSFPGNLVTLGTGEVTLNFDIAPAPGLNWQDVTGVRITKVIDDAGRPGAGGTLKEPEVAGGPFDVQVFGPGRVVVVGWDFEGNPAAPSSYPNPRVVPVPIKLATPAARSLKSLEGVVIAEVIIPNQTLISIDDPANRSGAVDGPNGTRLTVLGIQDGGKGAQPTMRVQLEAPSQWAAHRRFNPWGPIEPPGLARINQVQAIDATGKVLHPVTTQGSDDGMRTTSILQFTLPKGTTAPSKVLLVGPRPVVVEIPFKMENVPLP